MGNNRRGMVYAKHEDGWVFICEDCAVKLFDALATLGPAEDGE